MMTEEQLALLKEILGHDASDTQVDELHLRIKRAYVHHRPTEFRIMVSHRDTHRFPGALQLGIGDSVDLVAHTTERYIPVQVVALPDTPTGYYRGVITRQLAQNSRFEVGDSVYFSEDQVKTGG